MDLLTIAQSATPALGTDPSSGWVGAGLLGAVLAWLMFRHLPAKDGQMTQFVQDKDKHVETITTKFITAIESARLDAKADRELARLDLSEERKAREKSMGEMSTALNRLGDAIEQRLITGSE
jgi:hypothetical protein